MLEEIFMQPKIRFSLRSIGKPALLVISLLFVTQTTGCMRGLNKSLSRSEDSPSTSAVWQVSFEKALEESASTGKPILADFTGSDWCVFCTRLKNEVFDQTEFKTWAEQNVVLLELDYPRKSTQSLDIKNQNADLAKRYQIESYPTVLFIDSSGQEIGRTGYIKGGPASWLPAADAILAKMSN